MSRDGVSARDGTPNQTTVTRSSSCWPSGPAGLVARRGLALASGLGFGGLVLLTAPARADPPAPAPELSAPAATTQLTNGLPAATAADELKKLSLEQLMGVEVATVTSASKRPEKATDAPATVIVIDQRDIKLRGYSQLTDVLRDLPGMETITYYFSEYGTQVPVRGISGNNKIIVLVNGMRVNPPGGEGFPFRSDVSVRDVEQIEVIYGPGSTLYGQDAISAVINIKTRPPDTAAGGEVGGAGGLNYEREAWGSFGGVLNQRHGVTLTGYVQYHDSELTALNQAYTSYWQDYRDVALTKTNAQGLGVIPTREDFGLNLFARLAGFNSSLQVWQRQSERSSSEGFNPILGFLPQARWGDMSTVVEGKNTLPIGESVKLDSTITYNRYEIDPDSRYVFPANAGEWFLDDYKYGIGYSLGFEESVHVELTPTLSLLAGFAATYYDIVPKATFPGGVDLGRDLVNQGGQFMYTDATGATNFIPRVTQRTYWTYAGYLEAGWQVRERLRLIAGTRVTADDRFGDVPITPRAAVVYDLTDTVTAKYIYTRAYVAPAPYFADSTYDNGTYLATTNPDLKPEKSETHEINLLYNKKNVSLGLSAYYGTQSDIITVSDRGTPANIVATNVFLNGDPSQPRTLVRTANGGDSERYGVDVYGRATLGRFSPWVSYSYVDFRETTAHSTTELPGISRHNGRVGCTWAVSARLFVTPSFVIRSTPENVSAGHLHAELENPWELNLYILYHVTRHLDLFADLRNLTNNKNALGGYTGDAIPQETLHGMLGARLTF